MSKVQFCYAYPTSPTAERMNRIDEGCYYYLTDCPYRQRENGPFDRIVDAYNHARNSVEYFDFKLESSNTAWLCDALARETTHASEVRPSVSEH